MADIVLGIGTSHSPMLSTPHEAFAGHRERDQARVPDFAALARDNAVRVAPELAPSVTAARHAANQAALAALGAVLAEAALDALVIIGDDQGEWFSVGSQPALRWKACRRRWSAGAVATPGLLGLLRRRREPRLPRERGAGPSPHRVPHARAWLRRRPHPGAAEARALHRGRTTWVWECEFTNEAGKRTAVTRVTLAVIEPPQPPR